MISALKMLGNLQRVEIQGVELSESSTIDLATQCRSLSTLVLQNTGLTDGQLRTLINWKKYRKNFQLVLGPKPRDVSEPVFDQYRRWSEARTSGTSPPRGDRSE